MGRWKMRRIASSITDHLRDPGRANCLVAGYDGADAVALALEGDQSVGGAGVGGIGFAEPIPVGLCYFMLEISLGFCRLKFVQKFQRPPAAEERSEEHTSELQSLMRISYAVFCLKK